MSAVVPSVLPPTVLSAPPQPTGDGERSVGLPVLVALLVGAVAAIALLARVFTLGGPSDDYDEVMTKLPVEILLRQAWLPQFVVGAVFILVTVRLGWAARARFRLPSTIAGWAIGLAPCVALLALVDYGYLQNKGGATLPVVFLTFLTVGFTEELAFRGIGIGGFQQRWSLRRSWIASSALFGAAHIINVFQGAPLAQTLGQVVFTTLLGLVFGLLAIKSGSLILAMIAHGCWDIVAVTRLMREDAMGLVPVVGPGSMTVIATAVVAVGMVVLVCWRSGRSYRI